MKRVRIDAWKKGIVTRNNQYVGLLSEGTHWVFFNEVTEVDMAKPFRSSLNLAVLRNDPEFEKAVNIVEVQDHEIALQYENGLFASILTPGKHVFWKGLTDYRFVMVDLNGIAIPEGIDRALFSRKELAPYIRGFNVEPYEKAILYVDGKFTNVLEAGSYYFLKNATPIVITHADMRNIQVEIAGQEILTKDKAALRISFYAQYSMADIVKALVENKEYDKQLYVLIQLALREFIGSLSLDELLEKKDAVAAYVAEHTTAKLEALGIRLGACGIRDVILPGDMKEIMNQVLIAEKKAQANTIMRREETASTRSLLNTAKLMEDNPMLFKLKEMEYVEKIAERINSISVSGGSQIGEQLKQLFGSKT